VKDNDNDHEIPVLGKMLRKW